MSILINNNMEVDGIMLDSTNYEFMQALAIAEATDQNLYLTGKAGSGKTYFLKYLKKVCKKREMVILAPTGVAAINAGGQIDRKDVFAAFGEVLGLDLDRANANLSEGLSHYNQEMRAKIFDVLKKAYVAYENEVLERRKEKSGLL